MVHSNFKKRRTSNVRVVRQIIVVIRSVDGIGNNDAFGFEQGQNKRSSQCKVGHREYRTKYGRLFEWDRISRFEIVRGIFRRILQTVFVFRRKLSTVRAKLPFGKAKPMEFCK